MSLTDEDLKRLKEDLQYREVGMGLPITFEQLLGLLDRLEAAENCFACLKHEADCILSFQEAGEPTPDGGYRTKYAGQWYQSKPIDETPKCDCGLDEKFDAWHKAAGR